MRELFKQLIDNRYKVRRYNSHLNNLVWMFVSDEPADNTPLWSQVVRNNMYIAFIDEIDGAIYVHDNGNNVIEVQAYDSDFNTMGEFTFVGTMKDFTFAIENLAEAFLSTMICIDEHEFDFLSHLSAALECPIVFELDGDTIIARSCVG